KGTGWIHVGKPTAAGPPSQPSLLASAVDEDGRVDLDKLRENLSELGLVPAAQDELIKEERAIRKIAGSWFWWHGTVADKAATVLAALGQPATAAELNDLIGEGHNQRGVRGRLL